jgi:hypothetical protein
MIDHTYHKLFDDDSGKWLVLNECDELESGPFTTVEQADQWIDQQRIMQQGIDG